MKPGASTADICCSVLNSSSRLPGFAFISTIDLIAIRPLHVHCAEATAFEGLAAYLMKPPWQRDHLRTMSGWRRRRPAMPRN
jgi:hypothetical protein